MPHYTTLRSVSLHKVHEASYVFTISFVSPDLFFFFSFKEAKNQFADAALNLAHRQLICPEWFLY